MHRALIPLAVLLLAPCPNARAQGSEGLVWATGLGERFRNLSNPVVSSYALGRLAGLVCDRDPLAGSALFRQALTRAAGVSDAVFLANGPVLPVSSFTGLWKSLMPAAVQCDPALAGMIDRQRVEARLAEDRRQANDKLAQATDLADNPDRAAQLADAAITAADPLELDIGDLTRFLSKLRERAPDLADDLFPKALDLIASGPSPETQALNELGKYLFIDVGQYRLPDEQQRERSTQIGAASVTDFRKMRRSTNPDNVESYIEAVLKIATATGSRYYNPVTAYALTYQATQMAQLMELDARAMLDQLIPQIPIGSGEARQVLEFLGQALPDEGTEARLDRAIRRVLSAIRNKRFEEARSLLSGIDDQDRRSQVRTLVTFGEAAGAIEMGELDGAALLANTLPPGVKRAILYAGIIAAAPTDFALQELGLAMKDAESLPAEYRAALYSALAAALLHADPDRALTVINEAVRSLEDVRTSPRRARLDPRRTRTLFNSGSASGTDVPLITVSDTTLFEVIDGGVGRHNFTLQLPGAVLNLPAVIRKAAVLDPARLEAALPGLRDQTRLAAALTALAELRLGQR